MYCYKYAGITLKWKIYINATLDERRRENPADALARVIGLVDRLFGRLCSVHEWGDRSSCRACFKLREVGEFFEVYFDTTFYSFVVFDLE